MLTCPGLDLPGLMLLAVGNILLEDEPSSSDRQSG